MSATKQGNCVLNNCVSSYTKCSSLVSHVLNNCVSSYTKCSSLVSHVYRQHRDAIVSKNQSSSMLHQVSPDNSIDEPPDFLFDEVGYEVTTALQHAIHQITDTDSVEQKKKSALFILNLKDVCGLSESVIDKVIKETERVFGHTVGRLQAGVKECISKNSIDPSDVLNLDQVFDKVEHPFHGLQSNFLQEKFYQQQFDCIVSLF